jgi:hypothetical protein
MHVVLLVRKVVQVVPEQECEVGEVVRHKMGEVVRHKISPLFPPPPPPPPQHFLCFI